MPPFPGKSVKSVSNSFRACLKMGRGPAAWDFWVGRGGERRDRPTAVCSARTHAVPAGKTRRPKGLGGKGPLAALLVGHRPLRVCSLLAPRLRSLPSQTGPLPIFRQALRAEANRGIACPSLTLML
jgi:hypothetical protein